MNERSSLSLNWRPARTVQRVLHCLELLLGEIEMAVKMRPTGGRTKRPRRALLQLGTDGAYGIV